MREMTMEHEDQVKANKKLRDKVEEKKIELREAEKFLKYLNSCTYQKFQGVDHESQSNISSSVSFLLNKKQIDSSEINGHFFALRTNKFEQ